MHVSRIFSRSALALSEERETRWFPQGKEDHPKWLPQREHFFAYPLREGQFWQILIAKNSRVQRGLSLLSPVRATESK